jgi:serine/threonine-protein kinase
MAAPLSSRHDRSLAAPWEARLVDFERAWRDRPTGSPPPRWQDFLPPSGQPCPDAFLRWLLATDIECRIDAGLPALLDQPYFEDQRLGGMQPQMVAELVRQEYQLRWRRGQRARRREYVQRFPGVETHLGDLRPVGCCPRCGTAGVTPAEEAARDLVCPRCGAHVAVAEVFPAPVPEPTDAPPQPLGDTDASAAAEAPASLPRRLGRYEVLEEIARGGMGAIMRVRDPELHRDLANKVMRPELRDEPDLVRRFVEEAQITAQLPHPGIVPVHDIGRDEAGLPFLAMKLVRGQTLERLLASRESAGDELPRWAAVFEQVCQAVAFAHEHGVIHRDLKPLNVMVGRFGEVQVMDWGLAKVLGTASRGRQPPEMLTEVQTRRSRDSEALTQGALGTWWYMPPEQANGHLHRVDERADVFALGGILCTILTGKPPYTGDRQAARHQAQAADTAEALRRLDKCGADAHLVALAKDCLNPERDTRPRDAVEVTRRVAAYRLGVEERLRAAERERAAAELRAAEQRKRRRVQLALAGAVGLLLLGGLAFGWWARDRQARNAEAVAGLLDQCEQALRSGDAAPAAVPLAAAQKRASEGGAGGQAGRLARFQEDLAVLRDLDAVDQWRWMTPFEGKELKIAGLATDYHVALGRFGADPDAVGAEQAAARVSDSAVRARLVGALDRLLRAERSAAVRAALQDLDPDPFRDAVRDAERDDNPAALVKLAGQAEALTQPPGFAAFLGES